IYWERGVELLWLKLGRPSYFSCAQGASGLFSRRAALEYQHRLESFRPLRTSDFDNLPGGICPDKGEADGPPPTADKIAEACRREPALNYLVLMSPIEAAYFASWRSPAPLLAPRVVGSDADQIEARHIDKFYLYRCSDLRG